MQTFAETPVELPIYPSSWFRDCHTGASYTLTLYITVCKAKCVWRLPSCVLPSVTRV